MGNNWQPWSKLPYCPSQGIKVIRIFPNLSNAFFQFIQLLKRFSLTLINLLLDCIPKEIIQRIAVWRIWCPLILSDRTTTKILFQMILCDIRCVRCCPILHKIILLSFVQFRACWQQFSLQTTY